jgi:hypothetical protein
VTFVTACRCLSGLEDLCWNSHYNATKPGGVPSTGEVELNMDVLCPTTPAEISTLQKDLAIVSERLREASDGVIGYIWAQRYTPAQCSNVSDNLGCN